MIVFLSKAKLDSGISHDIYCLELHVEGHYVILDFT